MADKSSSLSDLDITAVAPVAPESPSFTNPDITSTTLNNLGVPPIYTSPSTTISGVAWATEYPSQASAITTALGVIKTAVDQAATAAGKFLSADSDSVFGDEETFLTANSQLTRVKDALDKVSALIESNKPASSYDAHDLLQAEDLELLQGNLSIVQVELQRAQVHISEWVSIGDMRVKEVNAALSEAQGYASEIQSRLSLTPMKISEYQTKVQDSLNEFNQANVSYQAKLQEAVQQAQLSSREAEQESNLKLQKEQQEYGSKLQKFQAELGEYQAKVGTEVQEYTQNLGQYQADYQWKQGQYAQLKAEYTQGLQLLIGR
jgi:chromosome segregation ATPase